MARCHRHLQSECPTEPWSANVWRGGRRSSKIIMGVPPFFKDGGFSVSQENGFLISITPLIASLCVTPFHRVDFVERYHATSYFYLYDTVYILSISGVAQTLFACLSGNI